MNHTARGQKGVWMAGGGGVSRARMEVRAKGIIQYGTNVTCPLQCVGFLEMCCSLARSFVPYIRTHIFCRIFHLYSYLTLEIDDLRID